MSKSRVNNGRFRKEERKASAIERQAARNNRSNTEQLKRLDACGYKAEKERKRLTRLENR